MKPKNVVIHRFTVMTEDGEVGFLNWLHNYSGLGIDFELELGWIFEANLADPSNQITFGDDNREKCYFTTAGFRKFRKAIKQIKLAAEVCGYQWRHIERRLTDADQVLYSDNYQLVIDEGEKENDHQDTA